MTYSNLVQPSSYGQRLLKRSPLSPYVTPRTTLELETKLSFSSYENKSYCFRLANLISASFLKLHTMPAFKIFALQTDELYATVPSLKMFEDSHCPFSSPETSYWLPKLS